MAILQVSYFHIQIRCVNFNLIIMKMLQFISLLVTTLFFTQNAFSHGSCNNRNSCNWTINTEWQYKAFARCSKFGIPSSTTDKDCPYTSGDGYAYAYKDNGCAWQSSTNNYGSWSFDGSVYKNKRICARGFSNSELYYDIAATMNDGIEDYESSKVKTSKTIFSEDAVTINSMSGFLEAKGDDLFSSFEIKMWLPNSEEDTEITTKKTFFEGKVELLNGQLLVTGDFPKDAFFIEEHANGIFTVKFNQVMIQAKLPKGINGKTDLIEVVGISDGGVHEAQVLSTALADTEEDASFILSPNPTTDLLTISTDLKTMDQFVIKIYDLQGREISTLGNNINTTELNNYTVDLKPLSLNNGTYFILLQTEEKSYLRKVVYQQN